MGNKRLFYLINGIKRGGFLRQVAGGSLRLDRVIVFEGLKRFLGKIVNRGEEMNARKRRRGKEVDRVFAEVSVDSPLESDRHFVAS